MITGVRHFGCQSAACDSHFGFKKPKTCVRKVSHVKTTFLCTFKPQNVTLSSSNEVLQLSKEMTLKYHGFQRKRRTSDFFIHSLMTRRKDKDTNISGRFSADFPKYCLNRTVIESLVLITGSLDFFKGQI